MAITKMRILNSGVNYFTFRSYLLFFERRLDGVDDPPRREERGHRTVPDRDRSRQPWSVSGSAQALSCHRRLGPSWTERCLRAPESLYLVMINGRHPRPTWKDLKKGCTGCQIFHQHVTPTISLPVPQTTSYHAPQEAALLQAPLQRPAVTHRRPLVAPGWWGQVRLACALLRGRVWHRHPPGRAEYILWARVSQGAPGLVMLSSTCSYISAVTP
jgi:hypothetical protein